MRRPRRLPATLATVLPLLLTGLSVRTDAQPVKPAPELAPLRPVPGGPKISPLPDLVVDAINASWGQSSPCTGPHTATFDVTVTLRNAGAGTAVLPPFKNWIVAWSVKGSTAAPYKQLVGQPPTQLASGQKAVLKVKLGVWAQVTPDKKTSSVGIGVMANPDKAIKEFRQDNNTEYKQLTFAGELCPSTR